MENTTMDKDQIKKKAEGLADRIADTVGGAIEKVGHKVSEAGAPSLGQKIHDLGDKLETEHKNPEHPHTV